MTSVLPHETTVLVLEMSFCVRVSATFDPWHTPLGYGWMADAEDHDYTLHGDRYLPTIEEAVADAKAALERELE